MSKPLDLFKSHTYTGYQLYTHVRYTDQTADVTFRYIVTTVLDWLRSRINDESFPEALIAPSPEESLDVDSIPFVSCHYRNGFSIDITALESQDIWALMLKEPHVNKGNEPGIPGRSLQTHIALHILDDEWVELGILTDVTDPVNVEEMASTYRPAIVRTLLKNQNIEMKHVSPLKYKELRIINSHRRMQSFMEEMNSDDQCLPAVIFTYAREKRNLSFLMDRIDVGLGLKAGAPQTFSKLLADMNLPDDNLALELPTLPYDAQGFADSTYGYGRTYLVPDDSFALVKDCFGTEIQPGDIVFVEPVRFGGKRTIYSYCEYPEKYLRDSLYMYLHDQILHYSKHKEVPFHGICFEEKAREMEREKRIQDIKAKTKDDVINDLIEKEEESTQTKQDLFDLQCKYNSLLAKQKKQVSGVFIQIPDGVKEAFADEIYDLIISVLLEAERTGRYAEKSRALALLQMINSHNTLSGNGIRMFEEAQVILSRNTMSDSDISELQKLGFRVERSTNNHPRIYLQNDEEHFISTASTPSDHRSGKNAASDLKKYLSVYK